MDECKEPVRDIAHLGHVELLTPKPEDSLDFFKRILGMEEAARHGQSVYLRGWGNYETYCMKLTEHKHAGIGHTAMRTVSPQALERRAAALEKTGLGVGWTDGDIGHGKSYRFTDPDGHVMELYFETEKYKAPAHLRPTLKNQPQKYTGQGICVRQLDHVNYLCQKVEPTSRFMQEHLGFRVSEQIVLDNGEHAGSWLYSGQKSYEIVYTADKTNSRGRLHHLAFWVDSRDDLMRAADIFIENDVFIEGGPAKHAIQQTLFLYAYEPGGNRIEICTGGYLIYDPDMETITWSEAERARGQAWLTPTISSFHTYGTPDVKK